MDLVFGMKLFTRVVETENFSEVARQFNMNPSSVSRQIASLEEELKTQLVNRTTRKISLTEAGRIYYEKARQILQDIEDANLSVSSLRTIPKGQLKISIPITFGGLYIVPLLPIFAKMYPEISIDLTLSDSFTDLVEEGYDLAIRIGSLADSSLIAKKLAPNRRRVVGTKSYFKRHGQPEVPADLEKHSCLVYKGDQFRPVWNFNDGKKDQQIQVSGQFRANNADALLAACAQGLGLAYRYQILESLPLLPINIYLYISCYQITHPFY